MSTALTIVQAMNEVMKAVGGIAKKDRNQAQGFNFRGIDSVVNAVSPQLQKYGVVVVPSVQDYSYDTVEIGRNRTAMGHVKVKVQYTFVGPNGDVINTTVVGEAMDSGDKATAKAMSVAFRTALLQSLCLPTDELDPDASSYERSNIEDIIPPSAVLIQIAQAKTIESLDSVASMLAKSKAKYSAEQMEQFREKYAEKKQELKPVLEESNEVPVVEKKVPVVEEKRDEFQSKSAGVTV